jgi:hypothetical protein
VTYLGYGYMALRQKIFGFLWKIFLETGPDEELLRLRLAHVKGVTTDFGTEAGIADSNDCLQEFLIAIGSPLKVGPTKYLLPNAVFNAGWHHLLDHVAEEDNLMNLHHQLFLFKVVLFEKHIMRHQWRPPEFIKGSPNMGLVWSVIYQIMWCRFVFIRP